MENAIRDVARDLRGSLITRWLPIEKVTTERPLVERSAGHNGEGEGAARLTLAASVESEDRAGDLILASGWQLESYDRNPVVLWAHQHLAPPIGRSVKTWVEGPMLMATVEFAPTPFAQEIGRLFAAGFLRGVSVGFRALETERRSNERGGRAVLFKRQELLEISAAPVPLNPDTLSLSAVSGVEREAPRRQPIGGAVEPEFRDVMAQIGRLWREVVVAGAA